jgi:hypothetical protein
MEKVQEVYELETCLMPQLKCYASVFVLAELTWNRKDNKTKIRFVISFVWQWLEQGESYRLAFFSRSFSEPITKHSGKLFTSVIIIWHCTAFFYFVRLTVFKKYRFNTTFRRKLSASSGKIFGGSAHAFQPRGVFSPRRLYEKSPIYGGPTEYVSPPPSTFFTWWREQSLSVTWTSWTSEIPVCHDAGRDSSVSTATRYGLDGPRIEFTWGWDFSHPSRLALGPTQPPIQWYQVSFPGVKRPGRSVDHPAQRFKKE